MRTKKEIMQNESIEFMSEENWRDSILEVLVDIRDELVKSNEVVNIEVKDRMDCTH